MTEKGCGNCYYSFFDERAYPCSLCIRGIERTDQWQPSKKTKADRKDEPQTEVETMSCEECKHWIFTSRWGWFCPLKGQDECHYEPIEDEPQTEVRYSDSTDYQGAVDYVTDTDCSWK